MMTADAASSVARSQEVLAELVRHLEVDVSFLRYNDHRIRATRLIAEWPVRPEIPDPDPLGVVYFVDADPIFAAAEHAKEPVFFRPEPTAPDDYQRRVAEGSGITMPSLASVPLLSGDVTTGALGFVKFGIKDWSTEELNALKAIASLFAQVQARIDAEEQLRFLADHDDLTGLPNRRALMAHLDERLRVGEPGPVSALFLDLDRLKAINDYLGHQAGDRFIRVFADRLRDETTESDLIARLGGDEFVVLVSPVPDQSTVETAAERILAVLDEPMMVKGRTGPARVVIRASIGAAISQRLTDSGDALLDRADVAMYQSKQDGGARLTVAS